MHVPRLGVLLSALGLALIAACRHSSPAFPVAFTSCRFAALGPVDSSWRQVRASGFTFCVPGSWHASRPASDTLDPMTWSGQEGSVTWGLGRPASMYPPGLVAQITVPIVTVPAGGMPNPGQPTGKIERLCPDPTATPFIIDSVVVVVTQTACHGIWKATAWSTTPPVYVQGEAHSVERAKLLNAIIATIRFVKR